MLYLYSLLLSYILLYCFAAKLRVGFGQGLQVIINFIVRNVKLHIFLGVPKSHFTYLAVSITITYFYHPYYLTISLSLPIMLQEFYIDVVAEEIINEPLVAAHRWT